MTDVRFGSYTIRHSPKPIPTSAFDWDFWHDDLDVGDDRNGSEADVECCKRAIREIEEGHGNTCDHCGSLTDGDYSVDDTCCFYCKAD